jgi:hypothetical protein
MHSPVGVTRWFAEHGRSYGDVLVVGKGPSYGKVREITDVREKFLVIGLNEVACVMPVHVAHVANMDVFDSYERRGINSDLLLMPWQPHGLDGRSGHKTLVDLMAENKIIRMYGEADKLIFYNLITGDAPNVGERVVPVTFGSADIIVCILSRLGVKRIRTAGIDGGVSYSNEFSWLKPLKFGAASYDNQKPVIDSYIKAFGLDYKAL